MNNPFLPTFSINLNELQSRKRIVEEVVRNIILSTATYLYGEPRTGKSSLMKYIADKQNRGSLFGEIGNSLVFSLINCQMVPNDFSNAKFWQLAVEPLIEILKSSESASFSEILTTIFQEKEFNPFKLQEIFSGISRTGKKFVLILDEFDSIINHPNLGNDEFLGILRGFALGEIIVIVVSRLAPNELQFRVHEEHEERYGSPFFNPYMQIRVGVLSSKDVATLLNLGNSRFSNKDREYIVNLAGEHPHILKITASAVWNSFDTIRDGYERYEKVGHYVLQAVKLHYDDLWSYWDSATRKAAIAITLITIPNILDRHDFKLQNIRKELLNLTPEVRYLINSGLIRTKNYKEYEITQQVFVWWLAEQLIRMVRNEQEIKDWLLDQQVIGGVLTKKELDILGNATLAFSKILEKGATSLIETFAKNMVSH